jgi:hypothetical protein
MHRPAAAGFRQDGEQLVTNAPHRPVRTGRCTLGATVLLNAVGEGFWGSRFRRPFLGGTDMPQITAQVMTRVIPHTVMRALLRSTVPAIFLAAAVATPLHAQNPAVQNPVINDIKGKIFDAKMAQQTFAGGLKHCTELNGSTFYMQQRDRVIGLEDFHRSLDNLAMQHVYNPETKRPWSQEDANARWDQVRKQAASDQANCALVASLPDLQKRLDELQRQAAAANPPGKK